MRNGLEEAGGTRRRGERGGAGDHSGAVVKAGWELRPLGELCEILDYLRRPITKKDRQPGDYPYYGATGILDYVEGYLFDERLVLIGEDGAKWGAGERTAFSAEGRYWVNNHAHVVRPTKDLLLDDWLIYYLVHSDLSPFVSGLTVPKLNQGNLREIPIPIPLLAEQQRIVAILDEAFEGIATAKANAEKNLQNARELFNSHLRTVFAKRGDGWADAPLSEFAFSISTGPFGSLLHKSDYVSDGVPLVNPINIIDGRLVPDPEKLIDASTKKRLENYVLQAGDIVIARRGEIGRCAVIGESQSGWICGTGCFFIRPRPTAIPSFLAHLIRSGDYRERLERASTGATMKNLSNTTLSNLIVSVPNLAQQARTLSLIESLSEESGRLEGTYLQKLTVLDELKQSLLHRAFNGEL